MAYVNKKARFATEGFRVKRSNPDGTVPTAKRFVGFANTADLSAVLDETLFTADLTIKIDNGTAQTETVDLSAAVDKTAVTVDEAVTALTAAAFTGITWSKEAETGRLMGTHATGNEIAVTGPLAAALDFGQGIAHGGNGLEFIKVFNDRTMSIGMTKNKKDKEEIDQEGAKGGITRMLISAKLLGQTLAIAMKDKDYELLELIQGGTFDRTTGRYTPPPSTRLESPLFFIDVFSPIYGEGENKMENMSGYEQLRFLSCTGMEGDVPVEAKAWANYSYDVEASEYTNENGDKEPAWWEQSMTVETFEGMNVETV
ncbi:MAG TPA: hypothetical protein PLN48_14935 [Lachnospiraceae bacterium]|nr:hypothetical protein [Lachnospiraceae bacterium]